MDTPPSKILKFTQFPSSPLLAWLGRSDIGVTNGDSDSEHDSPTKVLKKRRMGFSTEWKTSCPWVEFTGSCDFERSFFMTNRIRRVLRNRYTIVMIYYAFSLLMLMLLRPLVSVKFVEGRGTKSMYAALYFHPILIVLQAVFGGLLYYAFPYILIVLSLITSAVKMVYSPDQRSFKILIIDNFTNVRNLTVLAGHWLLHAYGIVSLTELKEPSFHGPLIALVPFPVIFYILTVRFTDPDNLDKVV